MPFQCQKEGCHGKSEGVLFPIPQNAANALDIRYKTPEEDSERWRGCKLARPLEPENHTALNPTGLPSTSSIPRWVLKKLVTQKCMGTDEKNRPKKSLLFPANALGKEQSGKTKLLDSKYPPPAKDHGRKRRPSPQQ